MAGFGTSADLQAEGLGLHPRGLGGLASSFAGLEVPDPAADEIVIAMRAVPINPSDPGLLVAPGDLATARSETVDGHPALVADVPEVMRRYFAARVGQKLSAGNEGAGLDVAAGTAPRPRPSLAGSSPWWEAACTAPTGSSRPPPRSAQAPACTGASAAGC
ncbi:MAG: hypothetical protein AAF602_09260 [Myxococcota bacterium]